MVINFTALDLSTLGANYNVVGLNNAGALVGNVYSSSSSWSGNTYYSSYNETGFSLTSSGTVTYVNEPNAHYSSNYNNWSYYNGYYYSYNYNYNETLAYGLNNVGQVVGDFVDGNGQRQPFVRNANGSFVQLPDYSLTVAYEHAAAINDAGAVVGWFNDSSGQHAYMYNGTYSLLSLPTSSTGTIQPTGINNAGDIVGNFYNNTGSHGFLLSGGKYTIIDAPSPYAYTSIVGINNHGQIAGNDGTGRGFVYNIADKTFTIISAPGAYYTTVEGINDNGQLVASVSDTTGWHQVKITLSPTKVVSIGILNTSQAAIGTKVTFVVSMNDPVVETGIPHLTLTNGATADYDAGATAQLNDPTKIVFTYTVASGDQDVASLKVSAFNLPVGSLIQSSGLDADLSVNEVNQASIALDGHRPVLSSLSETPSSGTAHLGDVITFTLTANEALVVAGTPSLTLNDGGVATFDAAASTALNDPKNLAFTYVVQAIDSAVTALKVTALDLANGTITDVAGNAADFRVTSVSQTGPAVNPSAASISNIVFSPALADLNAGKSITVTMMTTGAISVVGTPALQLSNGGLAIFDADATAALGNSMALIFNYAVSDTDTNSAALSVLKVSLSSNAAILDAYGNAADLSLKGLSQQGPQIDTTVPTLVGVGSSPSSGIEGVGSTIKLFVTLSEAVTVAGGSPTLILNDGGVAHFVAAAGKVLTFAYTVAASDTNTDQLVIAGIDPNGATIADSAGNSFDPSSLIDVVQAISIDTAPPVVDGLVSGTDTGSTAIAAGHAVTVAVQMSKPVVVTGTPVLLLSNNLSATFVGGGGTDRLVFRYTVHNGDNTPDLQIIGFDLSDGTIKDLAGNAISAAIAADLGIKIDTVAPTVSSIVATTDNGATQLNAGHTVTITLHASETLNVTGAPNLVLSNGATASYAGGDGTNSVDFIYTVASGEQSTDLKVVGMDAPGSLSDQVGNALSGIVADLGLVIDTTTPVVVALKGQVSNLKTDVGAGQVVTVTLSTSKPVIVDTTGGIPELKLNNQKVAVYAGGSGTQTLTFNYLVQSGDSVADLRVVGLSLNNGTIAGTAGTPLGGTITGSLGIQIDTIAPTLQSLSATTDNNLIDLNAGHVVTIAVNASEALFVDTAGGVPTLILNNGASALYKSGSGTNSLQFTYAVKPGDSIADLTVTALSANGAIITDGAENTLSGSIAGSTGITIDTAAPATSLYASSDNDRVLLTSGHVVTITLRGSEALTVVGTPGLQLNNGEIATYAGRIDASSLSFTYITKPGDDVTDLKVNGLSANGGSVQDSAGNPPSNVVADLGLTIDTTAPAASAVTAASDNGSLNVNAGHVVVITILANETLFVSGLPKLALNNGQVAEYVSGSGSSALKFSYKVVAGDSTPSLQVATLDLTAGQIVDGAGNAFSLAASDLGIKIDTVAPTISTITATPNFQGTAMAAGQTITISLKTSEAVRVDTEHGLPSLTLSDGGLASYVSGSGSDTLLFSYTARSGDKTSDLRITGLNANGALVTDLAGNSYPLVTADLGIEVDAIIPTVSAYSASPTGTALPGQTIVVTLTMSDGVKIAGGTPTLLLSDGGVASFDLAATTALHDPTKLVFNYTVSLAETSSPALSITGIALNGASVVNNAGTAAKFGALPAGNLGVSIDTRLLWTGAHGHNWSDAQNWSAGVIPATSNDVYVEPTAHPYPMIDSAATAHSLTINGANSIVYVDDQLTLATTLVTHGALALGLLSGTGTIVAPEGLTVASDGALLSFGWAVVSADVINNSNGPYNNDGVQVAGGLRINGSLTGTGTTLLVPGARLEIQGAVSQTIIFEDDLNRGSTLVLGDPAHFAGSIHGFDAGSFTGQTNLPKPSADTLDLKGVSATAASYANGILTVMTQEGHTLTFNIAPESPNSLRDATLVARDDGRGGTEIFWQSGLDEDWTGGSGDWTSGLHWLSGYAPGSYDHVVIGGIEAETISIAQDQSTAANLLDVEDPNAKLNIAGQLTLGTAPNLSGNEIDISGSLALVGGVTLDHANIVLQGGALLGQASQDPFLLVSPNLTFGQHLTIDVEAEQSTIGAAGDLTNRGMIDVLGGSLEISAGSGMNSGQQPHSVTNDGTIHVGSGRDLRAAQNGASFDNALHGQVTIEAGATAQLGSYFFSNEGSILIADHASVVGSGTTWSNTGQITLGDGASLTLVGNYDSTQLAGISYNGASLVLQGAPTDYGFASQASTITAHGGNLVIDPASGVPVYNGSSSPYSLQRQSIAGSFAIDAGASLEFRGDLSQGSYTSGSVQFNGADATLKLHVTGTLPLPTDPNDPGQLLLQPTASLWGVLVNLQSGDAIDVLDKTVTRIDVGMNTLTFLDSDGTGAQFALAGASITADRISLAGDGHGGTLIKIHDDLTAPTASLSVSTEDGRADLAAGHSATITLALSEEVTVQGTPKLLLSNGGEAAFVGGSGSKVLTFSYTASPGADTVDLAVGQIDFGNGGSIVDVAGNPLSRALNAELHIQVDTRGPVIASAAASAGVLHVGQSIPITVHFNEAVSVSGNATLLLSNDGTAQVDQAASAALNDPTTVVFNYTVRSTDLSTGALSITGLTANGAIIKDLAGNTASISHDIEAGSQLAVDTSASPAGASSIVYFRSSDNKLWSTLGTPSSTTLIASNVSSFVATDDALYYAGTSSSGFNQSLFVARNGATSEFAFSTIGSLTAAGDKMFFVGQPAPPSDPNDPMGGGGFFGTTPNQIFVTDGNYPISVGTLSNMLVTSVPMVVVGNQLFYLDNGGLYTTDGLSSSYQVSVTDNNGQSLAADHLTVVGTTLYFTAADFDGTHLFTVSPGGSIAVQVHPSASTGTTDPFGNFTLPSLEPQQLTNVGGTLYFTSNGSIWTLDASGAVPIESSPIYSGAGKLAAGQNRLFFLANDAATGKTEIFATNGTASSTIEVTSPSAGLSDFKDITAVGGNLYFAAYDSRDEQVHVFGWSEGGVVHRIEAADGALIDPNNLVANGNKLFFSAYSASGGYEVFQTDGTIAGTIAASSPSGTYGSNPAHFVAAFNGASYFVQADPATGQNAIWKSDGTTAGTEIVKPAIGGYGPVAQTAHDAAGLLYFETATVAQLPSQAGEGITTEFALWRTDGTASGTTLIDHWSNTSNDGSAPPILSIGSTLYYGKSDGTLWRSTPSNSSSAQIGDATGIKTLMNLGGQLYGLIYNYDGTYHLSTMDSTGLSMSTVAQIPSFSTFVVAGSQLYYTSYGTTAGLSGQQVWTFSGSTPVLLKQLSGFEGLSNLTAGGSNIIFEVSGSTRQLWVSDGTGGGTKSIASFSGNTFFSDKAPVIVGSHVLVGVNGDQNGLYSIPISGGAATLIDTGAFVAPYVIGSTAYYWSQDSNTQLWSLVSTGGVSKQIIGGLPAGFYPQSQISIVNGIYLFNVFSSSDGTQVWATDGHTAPTPLTDLHLPIGLGPRDDFAAGSIATGAAVPQTSTSGVAVDGYLSGATVFADANGNGLWDPGEASSTTDSTGQFTLTGGAGPEVLIGGIDSSTHLPFLGRLEAPNGSAVMTPLTTLLSALLPANPTSTDFDAAQQLVLRALGISMPADQTLTSWNPLADAALGDSSALAAFVAGAEFFDTVAMLGAALASQTGASQAVCTEAVLQSIASAIKAAPTSILNLTDADAIKAILAAADALVDPGSAHPVLPADARTIADIVAGSNQIMLNDANGAPTILQGLREAIAVERVSQGQIANGFASGQLLDQLRGSYTGFGLNQAVTTALNEVSVPCYCRGTMIAIDGGERRVEDLSIGDNVLTISGAHRPIKWIGRRSYQGRFVLGRKDIMPICFRAGSLGDQLPRRDLFVSPLHAMYLEDILIPASALVNGHNVVQLTDIDLIEYLHIELETHDVILAEGAAAETFIDDDSRSMFHNWADYGDLYPNEDGATGCYCAPRLEHGFEVEAARRKIGARAHLTLSRTEISGPVAKHSR